MLLQLTDKRYIDTSKGIDLSITLTNNAANPRAWYVDVPEFEPVRANGFIGSIAEGGSVNFRNIFFNPHGHCTHTECCGHISPELISVNDQLKEHWFVAKLITLEPQSWRNKEYDTLDSVVTLEQFKQLDLSACEALIIRTLPNTIEKKSHVYSGTNPPYFEAAIADLLVENGVKHVLVDLPSVDRELDSGILDFHHRFWQFPANPRLDCTITELIYVPASVQDGEYILNLQVAAFDNDAAPSRPVLFEMLN
jgi:kynurenine formamidase